MIGTIFLKKMGKLVAVAKQVNKFSLLAKLFGQYECSWVFG